MRNHIDHEGTRYYYEHRLAKDGEICLGTMNPQEYCNGVYSFSKKDPGDGLAFVVTEQEPISEGEDDITRGTSGYFQKTQIDFDGQSRNYE